MFSHFRISFANLPSQEQKKLELYLNLSHLSPISEFVMPTQEQEKWELGQESEFVKSVREIGGGVIGLVNNTNFCITFTSMRLLVERSKVFKFWKFPCQVFVSLFYVCVWVCNCICIRIFFQIPHSNYGFWLHRWLIPRAGWWLIGLTRTSDSKVQLDFRMSPFIGTEKRNWCVGEKH